MIGVIALWRLRNLVGIGLVILAIAGGVFWAKAWHAKQLRTAYIAGEAAEARLWNAKVAAARIERAMLKRRAQEQIAALELDRIEQEEHAAIEQEELRHELDKALAKADAAFRACRVPDAILQPLRRQKRSGRGG
jgi:hypothetical protein